jgi:hypothetical protein
MTDNKKHLLAFHESQLTVLAEMCTSKLRDIDDQILSLKEEAEGYKQILENINTGASAGSVPNNKVTIQPSIESTDGYMKIWGWKRKTVFILGKLGPSTTAQIANEILNVYEQDLNRKTAIKSISAILSAHSKEGKSKSFNKTLNERDENVYELIDNQ